MSDKKPPVILLEDDAILRELMADGLQHAGFAVVSTSTAAQLRAELETVAGRAILVADRAVEEQKPNGFQVAAELLAQYDQLRVIYISGTHIAIRRRELSERERAMLKPFAMTQLLTAVRDLADQLH